jgi:hypothetical protein
MIANDSQFARVVAHAADLLLEALDAVRDPAAPRIGTTARIEIDNLSPGCVGPVAAALNGGRPVAVNRYYDSAMSRVWADVQLHGLSVTLREANQSPSAADRAALAASGASWANEQIGEVAQ